MVVLPLQSARRKEVQISPTYRPSAGKGPCRRLPPAAGQLWGQEATLKRPITQQSLSNTLCVTCRSMNTRTSFSEGKWFQSGSQEEGHFEAVQVGWDGVREQRKKLTFVRPVLCASYQANFLHIILLNDHSFPGSTTGKGSACQCRRCKRCRFNSWVRKIPWSKKWQPTPVFLPG